MLAKRIVPVLTLVALLSAPLAANAQDQGGPPPARGHSGFMMSGRLRVPWSPVGATFETLFGGVVALPPFIIGAQLGNLGVGAGLNMYSWDSGVLSDEGATIFLFGPTITYAVAKAAGGRAQLHLLGSFSFGMGSSGDADITAIGFDFGVLGRALLVDAFGLDVGVVVDFLSLNRDYPRIDDETDRGVQIVGFLGGTFVL